MYKEGTSYHGMVDSYVHSSVYLWADSVARLVFAGKEPNRALAKSSLKPEDCVSDYSDLSEKEKQTLDDWYIYYSKRYDIVGRLPVTPSL